MNYGTRANKGCNLGSSCKDFHPTMCPMSITKAECFDHPNMCPSISITKNVLTNIPSELGVANEILENEASSCLAVA